MKKYLLTFGMILISFLLSAQNVEPSFTKQIKMSGLDFENWIKRFLSNLFSSLEQGITIHSLNLSDIMDVVCEFFPIT